MARRTLTHICVLIGSTLLLVGALEKGGGDETGPYEVVRPWPIPFAKAGYIQGSQGGVFAESPNRIFLAQRGELKLPAALPASFNGSWGSLGKRSTPVPAELRNCIVIVNAEGKVVETWTQHDHLFQKGRGPHRVEISPYDPERHVWVIDDMSHQIFKFTNDGKQLVMTLGEAGVEGNDEKHFGRPTDIAWLPDGTFFISDGYINARIVKFDKNGKFIKTWATKGQALGQLDTPHSIDIDKDRRLYVADRGNSRIQIFDEDGKYLDHWPNLRKPNSVTVTADGYVWVADSETSKVLKYDRQGKLLYSWGTYGWTPGAFWAIHQFAVDSDGNFYTAESAGGRTQKFRPKPSVDKSLLVGPPVPLMSKN